MLLIHCSLAHSGAWKGLATILGSELEMRAFDMPGHGRSDDLPEGVDMQALCVAQAVDVIGADGPMDIIGHSFGATVALRLAIEHPDLVRSLVMIESVFFAAALADNPELTLHHGALMAGYNLAVKRGDMMEAAREFLREWGDGTPWDLLPEQQRAFLASKIHLIEANNQTVLEDRPGVLERQLIETVTAPGLLIRGEDSSPFVAPIHAAIQRRMADCESISIEGAAHMAPITHPKETAAAIRSFLERVPV
ncbi:alpha/beta hydrolase [Rhodobacteraceae bacterium 10Alg 79]|uniref:Alpha/beta hydrolase n=1 Tax=Rhodalgimonas zhirmunskyi TaxID=2964767 RepID=A0AAJ1UFD3_9RHOB|nr:alpha/beta hydrolase [Rhodoalgimonas zhirmunskyi]